MVASSLDVWLSLAAAVVGGVTSAITGWFAIRRGRKPDDPRAQAIVVRVGGERVELKDDATALQTIQTVLDSLEVRELPDDLAEGS